MVQSIPISIFDCVIWYCFRALTFTLSALTMYMYGTIQHTHSTWRIPNERWLPYCKGASIESAYCSPCLPKHMLRCKAMLKIYSDIRLNTGFLQIVKFISYWRNSIFITELKVISICSLNMCRVYGLNAIYYPHDFVGDILQLFIKRRTKRLYI